MVFLKGVDRPLLEVTLAEVLLLRLQFDQGIFFLRRGTVFVRRRRRSVRFLPFISFRFRKSFGHCACFVYSYFGLLHCQVTFASVLRHRDLGRGVVGFKISKLFENPR